MGYVEHPIHRKNKIDENETAVNRLADQIFQRARGVNSETSGKSFDELDVSLFRADELTKGDPQPEKFLLSPIIPEGTAGAIFGEGGIGKSMVALSLCLSISTLARSTGNLGSSPGPLAGSIPKEAAGAAIFLNLEDSVKSFHGRVHSLDPERKRDGAPFYYIPAVELPDFDPVLVRENGRRAAFTRFAETGIDRLLDKVETHSGYPVRLLVLDPAGDFIDGPEDSADFVKPLMRRLRNIAARRKCVILLVGHTAKSSGSDTPSMRGSGAWMYNGRFAYALSKPERSSGKAAPGKPDPRRHVYGELVKANHKGAPINVRRTFERDDSGHLRDVTAEFSPKEAADDVLFSALSDVCRSADLAGKSLTRTGPKGLFKRRSELPSALADLSRAKLENVAEAAVEAGCLVLTPEGFLVPAPMGTPD